MGCIAEFFRGVNAVQFAARTHVGLVRKSNQDGYLIRMREERECIALVADGMGGQRAGEVASALAIDMMWEYLSRPEVFTDPASQLQWTIKRANDAIYEKSREVIEYAGMGTTVVATYATPETVHYAHVGDSRIYMFSKTYGLRRLTEDHSLVHELVRRGQVTAEEAFSHPQRHLLTRALGTLPTVEAECASTQWHEGDLLLMCSDGLTTCMLDREIEACFHTDVPLHKQVDDLVEISLSRGAPDNITVIALLHDGEPVWRDSRS
ncbi:hypothetical protein ATW55_06890 [Ferroacidibacillus organovorans]|uniref:PPM-type phosphatase domain-containing protein n=1 Tax=Ferroacidibacillus organovorans TaxID=1765683 RepID=A0A101XQB0_9BACL|nr:hypothetical protein ATW55_06890 [Ferroacidibacillus organovorans]